MIDAYCISSDERFSEIENELPFDVKQWPSVNLIQNPRDERAKELIDLASRSPESLNYGCAGCGIAHASLWKKIAEEKKSPAVIMEDDAVVSEQFEKQVEKILSRLPDGEFFNLCTRRPVPNRDLLKDDPKNISKARFEESTGGLRKMKNVCFVCYVIKPVAAEKLWRAIESYDLNEHIDWWFAENQIENINTYVMEMGKIVSHDNSVESLREQLNVHTV